MRCSIKDVAKVLRVIEATPHEDVGDDCLTILRLLTVREAYVLMPSEDIVFVMEPLGGKRFSLHVAAMRNYNHTVADGVKAVNWMFANTDCKEILGLVPAHRRDVSIYAMRLCRAVKGKKDGIIYRVRR